MTYICHAEIGTTNELKYYCQWGGGGGGGY